MTRRPSKLRRFLKWAGLVVCLLIVVGWGFSLIWLVALQRKHFCAGLYPGRISFTHQRALDDPGRRINVDAFCIRRLYTLGSYSFALTPRKLGFNWPNGYVGPLPDGTYTYSVDVPLWLALVVIAFPTAFLWYRDRRPPPGYCQTCGYNLTGLPEPRCPECGQPFDEEETT